MKIIPESATITWERVLPIFEDKFNSLSEEERKTAKYLFETYENGKNPLFMHLNPEDFEPSDIKMIFEIEALIIETKKVQINRYIDILSKLKATQGLILIVSYYNLIGNHEYPFKLGVDLGQLNYDIHQGLLSKYTELTEEKN